MVDVGDAARLTVTPRDPDSNPVDVTDIALTITRPDGTSTGPLTPTRTSTGSYSYSFTTVQPGRHVARWAGTGFAETNVFNVWPADPRFMFSLDDARGMVGPEDDADKLRLYIAATTEVIEDIVGPVIPVTRTCTFPGGVASLILPDLNVTAVTVTQNTANLDSSQYTVAADAGIIYAGTPGACTVFDTGPVTVQYRTGTPVIAPNVLLAAMEEFRFLWQIGQQGNRPSFSEDFQAQDYTPAGFAVPRRVIEVCGNQRRRAWQPV